MGAGKPVVFSPQVSQVWVWYGIFESMAILHPYVTAQGPEFGLCQCYFQIVCEIIFSGKIIKKTLAAAKLKKLKT